MRLLFDHGTLVLAEAPELKPDRVPGLLWDPRIALFRAPAWRYPEVCAALRHCPSPLRDEVRPSSLALPASWNALSLRSYQRAALLSWELSGRRGTIVLPTGSGKPKSPSLRWALPVCAPCVWFPREHCSSNGPRRWARPIEAKWDASVTGAVICRRSPCPPSRARTGSCRGSVPSSSYSWWMKLTISVWASATRRWKCRSRPSGWG